jgi:hypothetical protein
MNKHCSIYLAIFATLACANIVHAETNRTQVRKNLRSGDSIANVFSRTISFSVEGFPDVVKRISGSALYRINEVSTSYVDFDINYYYDGRPPGKDTIRLQDEGSTSCSGNLCTRSLDASGAFYNRLLWGSIPKRADLNSTWTVSISTPWELGPAGTEQITVKYIDQPHGMITLQRTGEGDGPFADDLSQLELKREAQTYQVKIEPGHSKWSGYATFVDGIVQSDELLVERPIKLFSKELGELKGLERQYILLNRCPESSLK